MGRVPDFLGIVVSLYIASGFVGVLRPGLDPIETFVPLSILCLGGGAVLAFRTAVDPHDVWLFAMTTWALFLVVTVATGANTGPPQPVVSSVSWVVVALIAIGLVWGGGYGWLQNRVSSR